MGCSMKLNKNVETEILNLIKSAYTVDSILLRLSKKYPELKKSDILIVARKNGYHNFGKKDLTTTKGKIKDAGDNISAALTYEPMMKKIKNTLIGLTVAIILLLVSLYLMFGLKTFLISLGVVIGILVLLIGIIYFGYVKGNKNLRNQVKKYITDKKR